MLVEIQYWSNHSSNRIHIYIILDQDETSLGPAGNVTKLDHHTMKLDNILKPAHLSEF